MSDFIAELSGFLHLTGTEFVSASRHPNILQNAREINEFRGNRDATGPMTMTSSFQC